MSKALKAALLSALIFPGVGQLSAGEKKRGWFIIAVSILFLYFIVSQLLQKAHLAIAEMQNKGIVMDMESISNVSAKLSRFSDNPMLNILLISFVVFWIYAVLDAYQAGRKKKEI